MTTHAMHLRRSHGAAQAAGRMTASGIFHFVTGHYLLLPIGAAVSERKTIDPDGSLWSSVLASTGQPRDMT